MAETAVKVIIGAMLLICGIQDAWKKKILLWLVIAGGMLIGICIPFCSNISLLERLSGVAVGISVILISLATKGKIGIGDGILLCVTGLGLGLWRNLELFAIALLFAAVLSITLLILGFVDRKKSIPFVPFLFTAYAFILLVNWKG